MEHGTTFTQESKGSMEPKTWMPSSGKRRRKETIKRNKKEPVLSGSETGKWELIDYKDQTRHYSIQFFAAEKWTNSPRLRTSDLNFNSSLSQTTNISFLNV